MKRRLVTILPNTDKDIFAVYEKGDGGKMKQFVEYWAFYEHEDGEIQRVGMVQYDNKCAEICEVKDSGNFIEYTGLDNAFTEMEHPCQK